MASGPSAGCGLRCPPDRDRPYLAVAVMALWLAQVSRPVERASRNYTPYKCVTLAVVSSDLRLLDRRVLLHTPVSAGRRRASTHALTHAPLTVPRYASHAAAAPARTTAPIVDPGAVAAGAALVASLNSKSPTLTLRSPRLPCSTTYAPLSPV